MQSWLAGHAQLPGADTNLDGLANAHQRRLCVCLLQLAAELSKGSGGACWNRGSGGLLLLGRPWGSMGNKGSGGLLLLGRPRGSMGNKSRGGLLLLGRLRCGGWRAGGGGPLFFGRRGEDRGRGVVHHVDGGFGFHCLCCRNVGGFGMGNHRVCFAAVPTKYSGT